MAVLSQTERDYKETEPRPSGSGQSEGLGTLLVNTAHLSLGSNLGDRAGHLRRARELLQAAGMRLLRESSIYETAPRDFLAQPWFLNQVVEIETELFPRQLLSKLLRIERTMGRRRLVAKGPRTIDIDILLLGEVRMRAPGLQIPHPRLHKRRFVLEPLAELAPDLRHPQTGRTVREMLGAVSNQPVRRFTPDSSPPEPIPRDLH